jgi:hypothetical protein
MELLVLVVMVAAAADDDGVYGGGCVCAPHQAVAQGVAGQEVETVQFLTNHPLGPLLSP